jgi:hydroxymethylbilane synthase
VLEHADSARAARAERRVVAVFGGDCTLPLAAWARPAEGGGGELLVSGLLATPDGERIARGEGRHADPEAAADACIAAMREHGADEVLARIAEMRPAGAAK